MTFDFDQILDRRGTNAVAAEGYRPYLFGEAGSDVALPCADDEVIPMWVADMALASPPVAIEAMRRRLDHPILGYTANYDTELFAAFTGWCDRQYGWSPDPDHCRPADGVVPALYDLTALMLEPGDTVLTITPAYGHFGGAPERFGHELVTSALRRGESGWAIDFDDFEAKVADPTLKLFMLCHPHNPVGRAWRADELRAMADLCFEHDVRIVSDEIHCDLLRTGLEHTPLQTLYPDSDRIVTAMSASKTFNLAGLRIAEVVIPDDDLRARWDERVFPILNPLSHAATIAVFEDGDPWWTALRRHLDANFELLADRLAELVPDALYQIPEATYLAWLDLSSVFPPGTDIARTIAEGSGVLVEGERLFIADAEGHVRLNLACPRSTLADAIDKMAPVLTSS